MQFLSLNVSNLTFHIQNVIAFFIFHSFVWSGVKLDWVSNFSLWMSYYYRNCCETFKEMMLLLSTVFCAPPFFNFLIRKTMRKNKKKKIIYFPTNFIHFLKTNAKKKIRLAGNIFWNVSVIGRINTSSDKNSIFDLILEFYHIWPPFQWLTSLLTLVVMYWISGYYYNKYLAKKNSKWMDWKTRIIMILVDLFLNFSLGIYYMNYRETFIGTLMVRCPVFCSPVFWILEMVCFYLYYRSFTEFKKKK